jgi:hypothetical protein
MLQQNISTRLEKVETLILDLLSSDGTSPQKLERLFSFCPNVTEISIPFTRSDDGTAVRDLFFLFMCGLVLSSAG